MDSVSSRSSSTISDASSSKEPEPIKFELTKTQQDIVLEVIKARREPGEYTVSAEKMPDNHSHVILTVHHTTTGSSETYRAKKHRIPIYLFTISTGIKV